MRIHINTQELNAGISTVIKALSVRTTVSILEGIYLEASNGWLLLRCTDLSLQIETNVAATVQEEGAIVLPGRLFSEMVRRLPGEMTFIDVKKGTATIESGSFKTTLQGEDAEGFHTMSTVTREHIIKMKCDAFKNMIRQCILRRRRTMQSPSLRAHCSNSMRETFPLLRWTVTALPCAWNASRAACLRTAAL